MDARTLAEDLIYSHIADVEWMSIGEAIAHQIERGNIRDLSDEEFEKFQGAVDREIRFAHIVVTFN